MKKGVIGGLSALLGAAAGAGAAGVKMSKALDEKQKMSNKHFALFQMIYSARKKVDKRKIEFMAAIFIFIIVLAVVINIVFKGIQRYMVYGMGIFYCALYLLVKDTILLPIWDYLKKDKDK